MAWEDSDQIEATEWTAANDFFAGDKGAELYTGSSHIFIRTEDGQIYGLNKQDTHLLQANLNQKKQWPKIVEAKNTDNQITSLEMISTLFKSGYKAASPDVGKTGGWRDKFNNIKQMAGETVEKASAQMGKATSEISKAASEVGASAEKAGWKDKFSGLKDKAEGLGLKDKLSGLKEKAEGLGLKDKLSELKTKAEAGFEKASAEVKKAGAAVSKPNPEVSKPNPEVNMVNAEEIKPVVKVSAATKAKEAEQILTGEAALQRLQNQLSEFQADIKAIRSLSNAQDVEQYKQLAAALDYLIQKIRALPPK